MKRKKPIDITLNLPTTTTVDGAFISVAGSPSGTDFFGIRQRVAGDPLRSIDWPRTIARDKEFIRLREMDMSTRVVFAVDCSHSSKIATGGVSKKNVQLRLMRFLVDAALRKSCVLRFVAFSERIEFKTPDIYERGHAHVVLRRLEHLEPKNHTMTDFSVLFRHLWRDIERPSLIIILSDFIAAPTWPRALQRLTTAHSVVPLLSFDPRDLSGHPGFARCQGIESGATLFASVRSRGSLEEVTNFFEELEKRGILVWARFFTTEDENVWYDRLVDVFERYKKLGLRSRRLS